MADLTTALSKAHGVPAQHIMLAAGSGEILRAVTLAFTGPGKALVSAAPTFESPARTAQGAKADVRAIPVAPDGTLDLKAMARASTGAGLAFVCNPNNPTGGINPEVGGHRLRQGVPCGGSRRVCARRRGVLRLRHRHCRTPRRFRSR